MGHRLSNEDKSSFYYEHEFEFVELSNRDY